MDILNRAENALVECENAYAVLSMWINGIPGGEEHHEEACKVGAVMTLLNGSIRELTDARDCFQEHRAHTTGE
ncbi:hypothetical protein AA471_24740 [Salmonella enterica subsp. enterica]|nr:hypothetical protein [Salmonella enterica]ECC3465816.1 hypothetical protein [Salmonella enterica subsp. enterica]ECI0976937.1 hypothetical protein [Salmonella enterica subsp. enterica serovar Newport]EAO7618999.1 hypothetical protein [Salmonella enterica]EAQ6816175.1 hypothetical protein [Salmonella enterica]